MGKPSYDIKKLTADQILSDTAGIADVETQSIPELQSLYNAIYGNYTDETINNYLVNLEKQGQMSQDIMGMIPEEQQARMNLMKEIMPQYMDMYSGLRSQDVNNTIGNVQDLAGSVRGVQAATEGDDLTQLRSALTTSALNDMNAGGSLTDMETRNVEQSVRSGQSARGIGRGQGEANIEAIAKYLEGNKLKGQRQATAQSVIGSESASLANPWSLYSGLPDTVSASQSQLYGSSPTLQGALGDPLTYGSTALSQAQSIASNQRDDERYLLEKALATAQAKKDIGTINFAQQFSDPVMQELKSKYKNVPS